MEPQSIFDLSAQEFEGAIAELGLPQSEADQLRRQYRRQNSPFSGLYGLLDSVRGQDAEQGRVRADVLPMTHPEGMTGMGALLAGEAQLALPGGLLGAAEGAAMGIDAPGSAYQGMIPLEDMAGEGLGTAGMAMLGGGAVARPAGSVAPSDFGQGWSDTYHWTRSEQPFSQFDPDRSTSAMSQLGPHVGTLEAAQARALGFPNETGQMIPLRADLRRPFLNPQTNQPWSEMDLEVFLSDMADEHGVSRQEIAPIMRGLLAREGYTDIPYVNDVEDAGSISNIMLVDRPAGSDAVLRRQDAAFDPARRADPSLLSANRSAPTGAVGLLANESRAQQIARMLREGRGDEITEDMLAALDANDNMELADLYASGATGMDMPMDYESRMARAAEMGFDTGTPLYHGGARDFPAFDRANRGSATNAMSARRATWMADDPGVAGGYATFAEGGPVQDLINRSYMAEADGDFDLAEDLMRQAEELEMSGASAQGGNIQELFARGNRQAFDADGGRYDANEYVMMDWVNEAQRGGYDGLQVENFVDNPDYSDWTEAMHVGIFDPRNIRSRFARFDPRLRNSANLLAANASPELGLLAASAPSEQEQLDQLRTYLGLLAQ